MKGSILLFLFLLTGIFVSRAQTEAIGKNVEKVLVVFKTHLDVGVTNLSSVVVDRYITEFIPKVLDVCERLEQEGSDDRYVWTTGSWLIWKYLNTASPKEVKRLEVALRRGDIVWNAMPYTVESESMNLDLFETSLLLSKKLDSMYGKYTIAAKMTDVHGHTRSIIALLSRAGIKFLHIGVNPACPIPSVPAFCRWRDVSGEEIILAYQCDYGSEDILPDGKTVVSFNFTGDNHGTHSYQKVKEIYAGLRKRYPDARIVVATLNDLANELLAAKEQLPVVTQEIGDTWIYGYGSAPIRMAKFRALSALYSQWIQENRIDKQSDTAFNFALELGLVAEHTQGIDVKIYLRNWDKYDMDAFLAARISVPFEMAEVSWKELDRNIDVAIAYLPVDLQQEACDKMNEIENPELPKFTSKAKEVKLENWHEGLLEKEQVRLESFTYQMFDAHDYNNFLYKYLRSRPGWALADLGKPGLDKSKAVSVKVTAQVVKQENIGFEDKI